MIECQIEVFLNIFTVDDEKLKILLLKKEGSVNWRLPSRLLKIDESLEASATKICNKFQFKNNLMKECHTFSAVNRNKERRTIAVSYMTLINKYSLKNYDFEYELFDINNIPRMAFDHGDIIKNAIEVAKKELLNLENMKIVFPADFTFPELQKICESVLDEKIDRRNFRKKFLPLVEETGDKNDTTNGGRPAKLYRFLDIDLERNLFNVIK